MPLNLSPSVIITGGAGFIGSAVVRAWLSTLNYRVVCLDKLTYASSLRALAAALENPRFLLSAIDVSDALAVTTLLANTRPSAIVHLAAESHVDRSINGPAPFIQTNIVGTYTLLEAARSYWEALAGAEKAAFRFLYVSTDEVFGSLGDAGRFDEASAYAPNSPYSATKAAGDHLVRAWHHTYGLPVITSHCSNNYGPHQHPEKLIPRMISQALAGKPLPVYGDGLQVRDWLFVDDHVDALRCLLERGRIGERYCIGGGFECTNLELVRRLCDLLDELRPAAASYHHLIRFVDDRPGHDRRYAIDPRKIQAELGWHPQTHFETGLRKTVLWYLEHQDWLRGVTAAEQF
ncbi:MAG: dTDP-glucose 4,6-dehydratase [Nevskia sp.]|jgi:dTDP-glucose 4,6-dehydratase|nr:dTDP-glucose 4,6-dehydratase [Nevskia sp.]